MSEYVSVERLQSLKSAIEAKTVEKYGDLTEAVQGLSDRVTDIIETASGEVISLNDSFDAPLRGLTLYGKSTQDGTPSPDAPIPIVSSFENGGSVGVYGANLFDINTPKYNGTSVPSFADGALRVTCTSTFNWSSSNYVLNIPVGTKLKFSGRWTASAGNRGALRIMYVKPSGLAVGDYAILSESGGVKEYTVPLPPEPDTKLCLMLYVNMDWTCNTGDYVDYTDIMVCAENCDPTVYEPYKSPQTLPITAPLCGIPVKAGGNYTDSNDQQWVTDEVDFVRGVKIQRIHECVITTSMLPAWGFGVNSEPWQVENAFSAYFYTQFPLAPADFTRRSCLSPQLVGDQYDLTSGNVNAIYIRNNISYIRFANALTGINPEDTDDEKINKMREYIDSIGGIQVKYILAEPIETPLTEDELSAYAELRMNYPNTTIYTNDNAGLAVTYRADVMNYIENGGAYEAGKKAEYDAFWDAIQNKGDSANYYYAFAYDRFGDSEYNPKYPILCSTGTTPAQSIFYTNKLITDTKVEIIAQGNANNCFYQMSNCHTIRRFTVSESTSLNGTFSGCSSLVNIEIGGTIGKSVAFDACDLLSGASITSIINALSSTTSNLTVTLSKTAVETAFTTDGWNALAGTKTNWTISLV